MAGFNLVYIVRYIDAVTGFNLVSIVRYYTNCVLGIREDQKNTSFACLCAHMHECAHAKILLNDVSREDQGEAVLSHFLVKVLRSVIITQMTFRD